MEQAINAYEKITVDPQFRELERIRHYARLNEATALNAAREEEREKWQGVVADKDAELERLRAEVAAFKAKG
jgi:hypothetical protein